MEAFLSKTETLKVDFDKPCPIGTSLHMTFLWIAHRYPQFAPLVWGFCFANGVPVTWPTDDCHQSVVYPVFTPNSKYNSIFLQSIYEGDKTKKHGLEHHYLDVHRVWGHNALSLALESDMLQVLKILVLEKKMSLVENSWIITILMILSSMYEIESCTFKHPRKRKQITLNLENGLVLVCL